ncbi:hypothetical protein ACFU6L_30850, partial [Kitasatospora sp. NPDC057541]
MNAYDNQLPAGRVPEPGPEHAPSRKEDPIDLAASVYEYGWEGPAAPAAPSVVSGPVVPDGFLPRPIGPG